MGMNYTWFRQDGGVRLSRGLLMKETSRCNAPRMCASSLACKWISSSVSQSVFCISIYSFIPLTILRLPATLVDVPHR